MSVDTMVQDKFDSKVAELVAENESLKRALDEAEHKYSFEHLREHRRLTYLACPYSSSDSAVRQQRFLAASRAAVALTKQGLSVFSPVSHSHPLSQCSDLPRDWEFWERVDRDFLSCSRSITVLRLPGWEDSRGVSAEIEIGQQMGVPVEYMDEVVC